MKTYICILASLCVACASQLSAQTSVAFNLGGPGETMHDTMIFANGGVTTTATAWSASRSNLSAGFQQSEVVQWSPGIGVKNSTEVITNTPYVPYYVDNQDHYDFILFVFDQKVDITSVTITPSAGTFDLDASYYLGNVSTGLNLTSDVFADLAAYGFGSRINNDSTYASHSPRTFSINAPADGVNALLIGARVSGDADYDRFKISSLQATTIPGTPAVVPEPATAGLLAGSLALLLGRRRR
jgi:hypothetical protein